MSSTTARDPFTVFGLPRSLDVDGRQLEARYLKLSRDCHPDLHRTADAGDCIAILQRAAEVNDAWQALRDPWSRARTLLELLSPGVLDRQKKLDPAFLADALELAEQVAFADAAAAATLRPHLQATIAADWQALREALARGDVDGGARLFHASHYHRKALQDLDRKS